jgi:hypothetical protein
LHAGIPIWENVCSTAVELLANPVVGCVERLSVVIWGTVSY